MHSVGIPSGCLIYLIMLMCAHTQRVNCTPKENCRHRLQEMMWVLPLVTSSRWTPTILLKIPHRKESANCSYHRVVFHRHRHLMPKFEATHT